MIKTIAIFCALSFYFSAAPAAHAGWLYTFEQSCPLYRNGGFLPSATIQALCPNAKITFPNDPAFQYIRDGQPAPSPIITCPGHWGSTGADFCSPIHYQPLTPEAPPTTPTPQPTIVPPPAHPQPRPTAPAPIPQPTPTSTPTEQKPLTLPPIITPAINANSCMIHIGMDQVLDIAATQANCLGYDENARFTSNATEVQCETDLNLSGALCVYKNTPTSYPYVLQCSGAATPATENLNGITATTFNERCKMNDGTPFISNDGNQWTCKSSNHPLSPNICGFEWAAGCPLQETIVRSDGSQGVRQLNEAATMARCASAGGPGSYRDLARRNEFLCVSPNHAINAGNDAICTYNNSEPTTKPPVIQPPYSQTPCPILTAK